MTAKARTPDRELVVVETDDDHDGASEHTAGASMRSLERFLSALTPEQAAVAPRQLGCTQGLPADLVEHLARAAELRRGPARKRKGKPPAGPMDLQTFRARAWVLTHAHEGH